MRNTLEFLKCIALISSAALIAGSNALADTTRKHDTPDATAVNRSNAMTNVNELVARYIAAWNERDQKRRRDLIAKTWADGGGYVDAHRRGEGHDGIDAMIDTAQRRFPGYQLRLVSGIETHNGYVRFSWAAGGSEQAPLYLAGTDFAVVSGDGRFETVTGFVDAAPAPVAAQ